MELPDSYHGIDSQSCNAFRGRRMCMIINMFPNFRLLYVDDLLVTNSRVWNVHERPFMNTLQTCCSLTIEHCSRIPFTSNAHEHDPTSVHKHRSQTGSVTSFTNKRSQTHSEQVVQSEHRSGHPTYAYIYLSLYIYMFRYTAVRR